jgi:hypothetical protein
MSFEMLLAVPPSWRLALPTALEIATMSMASMPRDTGTPSTVR